MAKEEIEKLKVEAQANKDHMQQVLILLSEVLIALMPRELIGYIHTFYFAV